MDSGPKFGGGKEWQKAGEEYTKPSDPGVDQEEVFALKSLTFGLESRHLKASHFSVMYNDIILFHLRDHIKCDLTLFKELFD